MADSAQPSPPPADLPAPPTSKTKLAQTTWPTPLTIPPTSPNHTHTIILLHGRGSSGPRFGPALLNSATTSSTTTPSTTTSSTASPITTTLSTALPTAKFLFPTSKKRRSTILNRVPIAQWFDNYSLADPSQRPELQYDGLRETSAFVRHLIDVEAAALGEGGRARVVVGGLSQGCAAALVMLLSCDQEEPVGGFVGMSGWLPFAGWLDPRGEGEGEGEEVFGFEDGGEEYTLEEVQVRAANVARDIVSLPPLGAEDEAGFSRTPVFLGHGRDDEKVSVGLGRQARDVLEALGCRVWWADYDEGHWYKVPEEIDDVVRFLRDVVGVGRDE